MGSLHLDKGSTCSSENKQMMNEDALLVVYNISYMLSPFKNSKASSVLMINGDFNSVSAAKINNAFHYSQQ